MLPTINTFDPQALRLIGALKFEPGYIYLCDLLQARLDNLTDELADRGLSELEAPAKLRYWQAFRDILGLLKNEPANFCIEAETEHPDNLPDKI